MHPSALRVWVISTLTVKSQNTGIFLVSALLLLGAGLASFSRLSICSNEPFQWENSGGSVRISHVPAGGSAWAAGLAENDRIKAVDGEPVGKAADVLFCFKRVKAGSSLVFTVERNGVRFPVSLSTGRKYNPLFLAATLVLGLLFWAVGVFVFLKKRAEKAARAFGWGMAVIAYTLLAASENFPFGGSPGETALSVLYCLVYPLVPSFILLSTLLYPKPKRIFERHPAWVPALFIPAVPFMALFTFPYLSAIRTGDFAHVRLYFQAAAAFRLFFAAAAIYAIGALLHTHRHGTRSERLKVRWILWALGIGLAPFLFLWTLPLALGFRPWIPEVVNYLFMLVIPVAIGFSIVKYHIWDIDVLVGRGIVYTLLTSAVVLAYFGLAGLVGHTLGSGNPKAAQWITVLYTLAAAAAFAPLRRRIQQFVDRTFHKVRYNYRFAVQEYSRTLAAADDPDALPDLFLSWATAAIPSEIAILLLRDEKHGVFRIAASLGLSVQDRQRWHRECDAALFTLAESHRRPMVRRRHPDAETAVELPAGACPERFGIEAVIPVTLDDRLAACIAMGRKRSDDPYTDEDFQLLTPMGEQTLLTRKRLDLRDGMVREKAEREKLEALNRLKSEFVSHVSHEFRTPLTAIRFSTANLLDGIPQILPGPMRDTVLRIDECSAHLDRMIVNLLDLTRIEAGRIELHMESVPVRQALESAAAMLRPSAERKRIRFHLEADEAIRARADRDALMTVLTNLLDNAVKYSPEGSDVRMDVRLEIPTGLSPAGHVAVSVADSGYGIPAEKQTVVFEQFERVRSEKTAREKGLGLGLFLVKKLTDLQGGRISLESEPGRGSTFTVRFPRSE
jgi:signal transduction histidine kinase